MSYQYYFKDSRQPNKSLFLVLNIKSSIKKWHTFNKIRVFQQNALWFLAFHYGLGEPPGYGEKNAETSEIFKNVSWVIFLWHQYCQRGKKHFTNKALTNSALFIF